MQTYSLRWILDVGKESLCIEFEKVVRAILCCCPRSSLLVAAGLYQNLDVRSSIVDQLEEATLDCLRERNN